MHRAWWACLGVLLLLHASPVRTQEATLLGVIESRSDLTTFAVFVNAAYPEVRDLLEASEPLTVFAPSNTAFSNLASLLEVPLQELLQNPEVISQIVRYHLIAERNNRAELATRSGQVLPTLLRNAFVGVRVREARPRLARVEPKQRVVAGGFGDEAYWRRQQASRLRRCHRGVAIRRHFGKHSFRRCSWPKRHRLPHSWCRRCKPG